MFRAAIAANRRRDTSLPTNTVLPEISGAPREGEPAWIYAGADDRWSGAPNMYRYKRYRDGVLVETVVQAEPSYQFDWVTADVDAVPSATVEASSNFGPPWSAPAACTLNFQWTAAIIEPNAISNGHISLVSASGDTDFVVLINHPGIYPTYRWLAELRDSDFVLKWRGWRGVSHSELQSPFEYDSTIESDPSWQPAMAARAPTDIFLIKPVSADYQEANNPDSPGVAGNWMVCGLTTSTGYTDIRITFPTGHTALTEIELANSVGGGNFAPYVAWTPEDPGVGNFVAWHYFDENVGNVGGMNGAGPQSLVGHICMPVFGSGGEARFDGHNAFYTTAPGDILVELDTSNTFPAPFEAVNETGLTWDSVAPEEKAFSWSVAGALATPGLKLLIEADPAYLYTDSGSTLVTANNDPVQQANDKSGNGNHLRQTTSGSRPLYKTGASTPYIQFDGSDDLLASLASYAVSDGSGQHWLAISCSLDSVAGAHVLAHLMKDSTAADVSWVFSSGTSAFISAHGGGGGATESNAGPLAASTPVVLIYAITTSAAEVFINNATDGSTSVTPPLETSVAELYLGAARGGGFPTSCRIYGIAQGTGTLSPTDRADLQAYMAALHP